MTARERRLQGDQGASLVLALAFLTLFSVFAVSILALSGTGFRNTGMTRSRVNQLYAADGGVEWAIRNLQTDGEWCASEADTPSAPVTVPSPVNGAPITVTCQTVDGGRTTVGGGSPLMSGHVAVIGSGGVTVNGGGWGPAEIHGNMYSGGPMSITWENPSLCSSWGSLLLAASGLQQPAANVCAWIDVEGNLSVSQSTCPPQFVYPTGACTTSAPAPTVAVPTVKIPAVAPHTATDLMPYGVDCIIMYPGKYTSPPTFNASRKYYMASGTYYFANSSTSGDVVLQGQIVGGMPSAAEPWGDTEQVNGMTSCAAGVPGYTPDSLAAFASTVLGSGAIYDSTKAGTGVTIVRGSSAKLRVSGANTKVELYTRVPGTAAGSYDLGATAGVTFWANTSTTGASPVVSTSPYSPVPNTCTGGCEVFVTTEKQVDVVFHGLSWVANSHVNITEPFNEEVGGGGGSVSFFLGGLAAKKLTVSRFYEGTIKKVSLAGTGEPEIQFDPRTTRISATATGGGAPTSVEAIVYLPTDSTAPTVQSWRRL